VSLASLAHFGRSPLFAAEYNRKMRTGLRNALVLSLLVAAAGLTWYWSLPAPGSAGTDGPRGPGLGYYMLDAVLSGTNAEGDRDVEIRTARLTELPDEDRLVLEDLVIAQTLDESAWRMSADGASAPTDGSVLALEGNVELHVERPDGDPYIVRTPRLTFDRARQVARSSGPIELLVGRQRITAGGFEADLNARHLRLESVQGMKTSQLTNAVAVAVFSAGAAAQSDPAESQQEVGSFEAASVDCSPEEECVLQGLVFTGKNWRVEAREARALEIEAVGDGEVRLTDVHFEFEDMSFDTPSAVFEFANDAIVKAALAGDRIQFEADGARFAAQRVVFTFDNEEPATAELSGNPAAFEDLSAERQRPATATADTIFYDYRERELRILGDVTFKQEGRGELRLCEFIYDLDTGRYRSGESECEGAAVQGRRSAPARENGDPAAPADAP
jgi:LPS export ABC transporter protein LptC